MDPSDTQILGAANSTEGMVFIQHLSLIPTGGVNLQYFDACTNKVFVNVLPSHSPKYGKRYLEKALLPELYNCEENINHRA